MSETDIKSLTDDQQNQLLSAIKDLQTQMQSKAVSADDKETFSKLQKQRSLVYHLRYEAQYDNKQFKVAQATNPKSSGEFWCVPTLKRDSGYLGTSYCGVVRKDYPSVYSFSPSIGSDIDGSSCVINFQNATSPNFQNCNTSDYSTPYSQVLKNISDNNTQAPL